MARSYKVEGTKTFLYWSIGLLAVCLWAVRDGWFPSEKTLIKHPLDEPHGSFYPFNHTLAYLTGTASIICGIIHKMVK